MTNFCNKFFELSKINTNDLILIVSGFIIAIYTYFTYCLWKESVRQSFLQNTPIPALYLRTREKKDYLRLRNIGLKPMINTEIENWNIHIFLVDRTERYKFEFSIPLPNIVIPNEEIDINITQFCNEIKESYNEMSPLINPRYSALTTPVHVRN